MILDQRLLPIVGTQGTCLTICALEEDGNGLLDAPPTSLCSIRAVPGYALVDKVLYPDDRLIM
ncbi:hypothetical protein D9M71_745160 [compost metagenome]